VSRSSRGYRHKPSGVVLRRVQHPLRVLGPVRQQQKRRGARRYVAARRVFRARVLVGNKPRFDRAPVRRSCPRCCERKMALLDGVRFCYVSEVRFECLRQPAHVHDSHARLPPFASFTTVVTLCHACERLARGQPFRATSFADSSEVSRRFSPAT